jgi:dihydroneopterin aldolase
VRIHIQNYPVFLRVGYFPEERVRPQEVLISLKIDLPLKQGWDHDSLANTVDYGQVICALDTWLTGQEIPLLESVCCQTGRNLLAAFPGIARLWVKVQKPVIPGGLNKGAQISVAQAFHNPIHFSCSKVTGGCWCDRLEMKQGAVRTQCSSQKLW